MKILFKTINLIIVIFIILVTYQVLRYPIVTSDSGYYLAIARDFYHGKSYFTDLKTPYTPLAILFYGLPFLFVEKTTYLEHQILAILINFLNCYLFYRIIRRISDDRSINIFYSLFFLVTVYYLNGTNILLEPFVLCFQFIAILLYLKNRDNEKSNSLIFCGIAVGFSFLSKQYGLFILLPLFLDMIMRRNFFKKSLYVCAGILLPLSFMAIYMAICGENISQIILNLLGKGAYFDIGNGTGVNYNVKDLVLSLKNYILICLPSLLLIILILLMVKKRLGFSTSLFYLSLFPASFSILLFAYYDHYYIFIVPFTLIPLLFLLNKLNYNKLKTLSVVLLACSLLIIFKNTYYFKNKTIEIHNQQKEFAQKLNSYIPEKSAVYFDGVSSRYYYMCNYETFDYQKLSYSFYPLFTKQTIMDAFNKKNDYLIINKSNENNYLDLKKTSQVRQFQITKDTIIIFKKL